jgi:hypothetical protein
MEKLTEYCLNADHPRGKHKARVFAATCGISADNAEILHEALHQAARNGDAFPIRADEYGERYMIEWRVAGPTGSADLLTAWIVRYGESFPRFVSAYVRTE